MCLKRPHNFTPYISLNFNSVPSYFKNQEFNHAFLTMYFNLLLFLLGSYALLIPAQSYSQVVGHAPSPQTLTSTMSGIPVLPTPFIGVEPIQEALVDDGPTNSGFLGLGNSDLSDTSTSSPAQATSGAGYALGATSLIGFMAIVVAFLL